MFVTSDAFVQFLHPSAVAPPQQYWRMVTLTLERHWYLVVYKVIYQGRKVPQTTLVACDETLLDMLAEIPAADMMGIARLDQKAADSESWSLRWIDSLWKPSNSEAQTIGPLVFTLDIDPQARNVQLFPVGVCPERLLLFHSRAGGTTSDAPTEDHWAQMRHG